MPVGILLATLLLRSNIWGRKILWIALGSQVALPLYVFAGGWSAGFGFQGWITSTGIRLTDFFGNSEAGSRGALFAVATVHAFSAVPWVAFFYSIGLRWVRRSEEEQAILDGGATAVFRFLLARNRLWTAIAAMACIVPIMTEMVVSNLFQLPTIAELIYLDATLGAIRPQTYLSGFFLSTLPLLIVGIILLWRLPSWEAVNARESHFVAQPIDLGGWRPLWSIVSCGLVLLLVGLPLFSLVAKAGWTVVTEDGVTHYGWTFSRLVVTARESFALRSSEFYWSFLLGIVSTVVALAIAVSVFALVPRRVRPVFSLLVIAMLAVPGPLVGLSIIWLLNRAEPAWLGYLYDYTITAPILAQQFRMLPYAWFLTCATMASVNRRSWELAQLDGLSPWQKWTQILFPQTGYRWLSAVLLLIVLSIGELSCSILVLPPAVTTVSMKLFEFLHFGTRHQDSGLCLVLVLLGWGVSFVFWKTLTDR